MMIHQNRSCPVLPECDCPHLPAFSIQHFASFAPTSFKPDVSIVERQPGFSSEALVAAMEKDACERHGALCVSQPL